MQDTWEWLLNLERIRLGDGAPLSIEWQPLLPPYAIFGLCVLLLVLIIVTARRDVGPTWKRAIVATLRAVLFGVLVLFLCRPALVLQRERVERSRVTVLIDISGSMARQERYRNPELAQSVARGAGLQSTDELNRHSRLELALDALTVDSAAALRTLLKTHEVSVRAFADELRTVGAAADVDGLAALAGNLSALSPTGRLTDVPSALDQTLRSSGDTRLAAVILISDAQTNVPSDLSAALARAESRSIPIFPLSIGSTAIPVDLEVGPLTAEANVFRNDPVVVSCRVTASGMQEEISVELRLVDQNDGPVVARRIVDLGPDALQRQVEFRVRPGTAGTATYRAEVDPLPAEDRTRNNADTLRIQVRDEKLRVLYVEGYPRYEYRYLKNALLREDSIESSILLLSADEGFAQEGTFAVQRFPETPEELGRYDVVVLGDVDPAGDWLSPAQARMLADFVSNRGGGLAVIAGPQYIPSHVRDTPLEKLLPVRIDRARADESDRNLAQGYRPVLTPAGELARCFRFDPDPETSRRLFDGLPSLYWVASTLGPKPGAETLLEHPTRRNAAGPMPVAVLGRYGAGRTYFAATDETWLWRKHTGEYLHDAYWIQLLRSLSDPSPGQDRQVRITVDRDIYHPGELVRARLELLDPSLISSLGQTASLRLLDARQTPLAEPKADRVGPESTSYEASLPADKPGIYTLICPDIAPQAGEIPAEARFRVLPVDLESRRPEANHDVLDRIAERTGGRVLQLDELADALSGIPDRSVRIPDDITETLWDTRLALIVFLLVITSEWVLRKAFGMI